MNRSIHWLTLLLTAALLPAGRASDQSATNAGTAGQAGDKLSNLFSDTVVAKGKGIEIKQSQLDDEVIRAETQLAARGTTVPPEQRGVLEVQVLNQFIRLQLLESQATDADRAAGKAAAQKQMDDALSQLGSEALLNRQLKIMGMTRDQLMTQMTQRATAEAVVRRELKANVTDDDVKKFYTANPSQFEQPEMVRVSHILLATRDLASNSELTDQEKAAKHRLAEDVLKQAQGGVDFAGLVKKYSEDPGSKDKGGEYTFPRGPQMAPEFSAASFALKTNQISDIVTTVYGYHIIKLLDKIPARTAALDDDVAFSPVGYIIVKKYWQGPPIDSRWVSGKLSDLIRKQLETDQIQKQIPDYLAKLRKAADVQILDENLKAEDAAVSARMNAYNATNSVLPTTPK